VTRFADPVVAVRVAKTRRKLALAIGRGFQSFVQAQGSSLIDHRLAHVSAPDNRLPASTGAIRDSYVHRPDHDAQSIIGSLVGFLSEHQLKQFRTKRRRIRAYFGSSDNIAAVAVTIGHRRTMRGVVGGYMLKIDARHGAKSLSPASESYFLDCADGNEPLRATCWALVHLFHLQLQNHPITLYHLDHAALVRCAALITNPDSVVSAIERMAARLLRLLFQVKAVECVKGRFFDRANEKLHQLARLESNELVSVDLRAMAAALSRLDAEKIAPNS
jgi:hypothetical protein